ncbi:SRPBCC family protein [Halorussus halophilus]|uniref:SRPBCC family protein n=1 Tax=Halorussus halophilus TaxID=2650975 RepID=UPI0013017FF4|nr:SRPBCC family protein [Halorussus halophilus]
MANSLTTETNVGRTPDGRRLEVSRVVDAPADRLWTLLTETAYWPEWGPSVMAVDCPSHRIRAGTTGRVKVVPGVWVRFEVTDCELYRWTWRVLGIPATGHRVEPLDGNCRVVFELPLFGAGYAPVCALALERLARLA